MSVQRSLMIFLSFCFLLLFSSLIINNHFFEKRKNAYFISEKNNKTFTASVALKIAERNLIKFAKDYTFWDDMVKFTTNPDSVWAIDNIVSLLETSSSQYIWIYNLEKQKIYYTQDSLHSKMELPIKTDLFSNFFDTIPNSSKRLIHFFTKQGNDIVEMVGITIHYTEDNERLKSPNGYFFIGKVLDSTYLAELSDLCNSNISIQKDSIFQAKKNTIITFQDLKNWDNTSASVLKFENYDEYMSEEERYNAYSLFSFAGISLIILVGAWFFLRLKISNPLYLISKTLKSDNPLIIKKLENRRDEFGKISGLVQLFFKQKNELTDINKELVQLNEEIKQQNEEILMTNEMLHQQKEEIEAQSEQLEEINKELEKLSWVASKTINSVIITDADGNIEWVNEGFVRLMGITLQDFKVKYGTNLKKVSKNPATEETINECISKKQSAIYTTKTFTEAGEVIWIQSTLTPIFDAFEKLEKLIILDTDITIIKEAEQQIAQQSNNIRKAIQYARRIQGAAMESIDSFKDIIPNYFIFMRPKDIVSGDFYWVAKKENRVYFSAVDCTGHGVPGALMSILGISFLNEIAKNLSLTSNAADILNQLRERIIKALHQHEAESESKDGMDMALCIIDLNTKTLHFAGANNPMILVRKNILEPELKEIAGNATYNEGFSMYEFLPDKMPIAIYKNKAPFINKSFAYCETDYIYMFTDGYPDQFGGKKGRKFMKANLLKLIASFHEKPMDFQKMLIDKNLRNWRGRESQVDDILILGAQLKF